MHHRTLDPALQSGQIISAKTSRRMLASNTKGFMKQKRANVSVAFSVVFLVWCFGQTYAARGAASVFLSNLSHVDTSGSSSSRIPFGRDINGVIPRIAQEFHTGTNLNGYLLDTVT